MNFSKQKTSKFCEKLENFKSQYVIISSLIEAAKYLNLNVQKVCNEKKDIRLISPANIRFRED